MRWFLTNDEFSGRTIWHGAEPPSWSRSQDCWQSPGGHWAAEHCAGLWLINVLWPHVAGPGMGEIVEVAPPAVLTPLSLPRKGE